MVEREKILITGGAGFIGSHLVERLVKERYPVVAVDDLSSGRREQVPRKVRLIVVDVRDRRAISTAIHAERPGVVVHLAAQMNVRRSLVNPDQDAEVNVLGSLSVFRAAFAAQVRRIIYASSGGAVYGDQPSYPCRESDPAQPSSPYGISKLAAEHYGRTLAASAGREFVALRLANVYGPRQNPQGEAGVVSLFLAEILRGRAPTILGDGGQTRDFIWIGDVVEAFLKAIHGPTGVFNVGTGRETSILELYRWLARVASFKESAKLAPAIPGEVRRNVLCVNHARDKLGWSARTTLSEGLESTVRFLGASAGPELEPAMARSKARVFRPRK